MRARRLFVVLTCSVLVAAVFAATSLGRSDKNGSTTAASGTVVLSGWGASPDELKLLKQVLRGFAKTYPNIHVDYQPITGDYVPAMLAKFAARKPADVFYVDSNVFLDWVTQGLLEPLDSYAQQSKFSSKPFYPSLLNGFKYKGKIYGYPKDWSPLAMEVNTDLAAKAGVKPASITNWATLTAAARKLRGVMPSGSKPICLSPSWDRALAFVYQNGGTFLNPTKTKSTVNSPAAAAALNYYVGLIKQGLADIPAKLSVGWCGEALGKQKAAIIFEGNWVLPFMKSTYPTTQYGVFPMIKNKTGGNLAFTVSYSMAKDSSNKAAAWTLLSWLTGPVGQKLWVSKGLALPSRSDVKAIGGRGAFLSAAPFARGWGFANPNFANAYTVMGNDLNAVIAGSKSVAAMMSDVAAALKGG